MIEISERDYVDLLILTMKTKNAELLDFYLDLLKKPLSVNLLDDPWQDTDNVGDDLLALEQLLYERNLIK